MMLKDKRRIHEPSSLTEDAQLNTWCILFSSFPQYPKLFFALIFETWTPIVNTKTLKRNFHRLISPPWLHCCILAVSKYFNSVFACNQECRSASRNDPVSNDSGRSLQLLCCSWDVCYKLIEIQVHNVISVVCHCNIAAISEIVCDATATEYGSERLKQ